MADTPADYGMYSWAFNDPEVGPILQRAKDEGWTPDKLQFELSKTNWWRTTVASERAWNEEIARDPREALDRRNQKAEEITRMASQLGVTLDPGVADSFADSFYRYGWTPIQLQNSILTQFKYARGQTTASAAVTEMQLTQIASDYGVTLTDGDYRNWIISIDQGINTTDSFKTWAAQQSANLNPWAKSALDSGLTLKDITAPILNKVANELEINPNMINLTDSKWAKLMQVSRDKDGSFVMPSWSDVERTIRTDPQYGFDRTDNARQQAASAAQGLLKSFGSIG